MAVRPKFIGDHKDKDINRYYRVSFGPEYFEWVGSENKVFFKDEQGEKCTASYLGISE